MMHTALLSYAVGLIKAGAPKSSYNTNIYNKQPKWDLPVIILLNKRPVSAPMIMYWGTNWVWFSSSSFVDLPAANHFTTVMNN